jgi:hypothetical protein
MDNALEIKLGIGLCDLVFGASLSEAEKRFGEAEDTELIDDIEEDQTTVLYYTSKGFTLFFEKNNALFLNCVDIENPNCVLWGHKIFELKETQIIELFKSKGIIHYEKEQHDWGENRLSFDDVNVDFYFEKNKLTSVNYGKLIPDTQVLILPN